MIRIVVLRYLSDDCRPEATAPAVRRPVRAFARDVRGQHGYVDYFVHRGDHKLVRDRARAGAVRVEDEGVEWARGWSGRRVDALLAAHSLANGGP